MIDYLTDIVFISVLLLIVNFLTPNKSFYTNSPGVYRHSEYTSRQLVLEYSRPESDMSISAEPSENKFRKERIRVLSLTPNFAQTQDSPCQPIAMLSSTVVSWLLTGFLIQGCSSAPSNLACHSPNRPYSAWMANSVIAREQAIAPPGETESSIFLQIGFFQTAILRLLEDSQTAAPSCQTAHWEQYLTNSTASIASRLGNATQNTQFPLDRLSTFRGLFHE